MATSGRDIIKALIAGETDPDRLLTLMHRGVKTPCEKMRAALQGRVTDHPNRSQTPARQIRTSDRFMLLYGYTRVSAIKQDLRLQRVVLKCNLCVSPGL